MQAIGLFELQGYVPALTAVDTMLKTADVKFLDMGEEAGRMVGDDHHSRRSISGSGCLGCGREAIHPEGRGESSDC